MWRRSAPLGVGRPVTGGPCPVLTDQPRLLPRDRGLPPDSVPVSRVTTGEGAIVGQDRFDELAGAGGICTAISRASRPRYQYLRERLRFGHSHQQFEPGRLVDLRPGRRRQLELHVQRPDDRRVGRQWRQWRQWRDVYPDRSVRDPRYLRRQQPGRRVHAAPAGGACTFMLGSTTACRSTRIFDDMVGIRLH